MEKSPNKKNLADYESLGTTSPVNAHLIPDAVDLTKYEEQALPPRTWGDVVLPWRWVWPVRQEVTDPAAVAAVSRVEQEQSSISDEVDAWLENVTVATVVKWQQNAREMETALNKEARRLAADVQSMKQDAKNRMKQKKKRPKPKAVGFDVPPEHKEDGEDDGAFYATKLEEMADKNSTEKQCIDEARTIADTTQNRRAMESFARAACNVNTLMHNTKSGFTDKHLELLNDLMYLQKCAIVADLATAILTSLEVDVGRLTVTQLQFARKSVACKVWRAISTTASTGGLARDTETASKDEVRQVLDEISTGDLGGRMKSEFY